MPPHSFQPGANSLAASAPVQLDRVHHHLRQRDDRRAAVRRARPSGTSSRDVSSLRSSSDDVALAQRAEVVGDRRAADAAADDDDARTVGKLPRRAASRSLQPCPASRDQRRQPCDRGRPRSPRSPRRARECTSARAPHIPSRTSRDDPIRAPARATALGRGRTARSRLEQAAVVRVAELVVDGEVREVEEPLVHARVLPVDDPHALAVGDEVRGSRSLWQGRTRARGRSPRPRSARRAGRTPW